MIFCLVWGMVGSFISLLLSRFMAKKMMGVQVIDPTSNNNYTWLVQMIHDLARRANLPKMPEVGVYESPDVNAFATGPSKSKSLVAVSTGLLNHMNKEEVEGVMAHEIAHIQNGDMVTMTLLQGIINAFVMFFARVIAFAISTRVKDEMRGMVNFGVVIVLQIVFGILGSLITARFSRHREFRADAGSAKLCGRSKMIAALKSLQNIKGKIDVPDEPASVAAFKISGSNTSSFKLLWSTHPPLEKRIESLEKFVN
ncbi:UNVERIFIED_CONTAM: hypothetical protein GTU68_054283 [Idotea baltica]|nr:hypothetical protein [Idotea baltica]